MERKNYHDQLTMSMLYAYCEHYILTLGSRDVGTLKDFADKLPGSEEQKNAQIREAYVYMMLHPGCKMMAPDKDMPKNWRYLSKTSIICILLILHFISWMMNMMDLNGFS